jgi:hypothetical protein
MADNFLDDETLVPDREVRKTFLGGVSSMWTYRQDQDPNSDFPRPVVLNGRKFRRLGELRSFIAEHQLPRPAVDPRTTRDESDPALAKSRMQAKLARGRLRKHNREKATNPATDNTAA